MSKSASPRLHPHLIEHALQAEESRLFRQTQREVTQLRTRKDGAWPSDSQIRGLVNAVSPQGAGDSAHQQILRLHSLVTRQLIRAQNKGKITVPAPITRLSAGDKPTFWDYVAGRLLTLRSGNVNTPELAEKIWLNVSTRYRLENPPGDPEPAQLDLIHLRLIQTFLNALRETWEHPHAFTQEETNDETLPL